MPLKIMGNLFGQHCLPEIDLVFVEGRCFLHLHHFIVTFATFLERVFPVSLLHFSEQF